MGRSLTAVSHTTTSVTGKMMLKLSLVFGLAACVSADSAVLSSISDRVTSIGHDFLAVTQLFTISRMTSTVLVTETATTSIFPTCTTATVASCAPHRSGKGLNFEVISPTIHEEIEMTDAPGLARIDLPADYEEENVFEFGELIFSSQETADCFSPQERLLADFVTFLTSATATTTVTTTETDTATTVTISYQGCVPSDALSTTVCS